MKENESNQEGFEFIEGLAVFAILYTKVQLRRIYYLSFTILSTSSSSILGRSVYTALIRVCLLNSKHYSIQSQLSWMLFKIRFCAYIIYESREVQGVCKQILVGLRSQSNNSGQKIWDGHSRVTATILNTIPLG